MTTSFAIPLIVTLIVYHPENTNYHSSGLFLIYMCLAESVSQSREPDSPTHPCEGVGFTLCNGHWGCGQIHSLGVLAQLCFCMKYLPQR